MPLRAHVKEIVDKVGEAAARERGQANSDKGGFPCRETGINQPAIVGLVGGIREKGYSHSEPHLISEERS
jgi:hypothetical protein